MSNLEHMQLILSAHKDNLKHYISTKNYYGTRHSSQQVFDWTVRIAVVKSFN